MWDSRAWEVSKVVSVGFVGPRDCRGERASLGGKEHD